MKKFLLNNIETAIAGGLSGYIGWALGLKMGLVVIFSMALHAMWTR